MSTNHVLRNNVIRRAMGVLFGTIAAVVVYHEGSGIGPDGKAHAYLDSASVWTICAGSTDSVKPGQVETPQQCQIRLRKSIEEHAKALSDLPSTTPDYAVLAAVDFAYNVGVSAARNSSSFRLLKVGDYEGAAAALGAWKYISDNSKKGKPGWKYINGAWRYDCSTPGNKVCSGIWKRRMWQQDTMQGKLGTAQQARDALNRYERAYSVQGHWVVPD